LRAPFVYFFFFFVKHPEASRSSIKRILEIFAVSEEDRGRKEIGRREEVSVLYKDDTGNDAPGGRIHEMCVVSNL